MSTNSLTSKIFGKDTTTTKRPGPPSPSPSLSSLKDVITRPILATPTASTASLSDELHSAASSIANAVGFGGKSSAPPTPSTTSTHIHTSLGGEVTVSGSGSAQALTMAPKGFSVESAKQLEILSASASYSEYTTSLSTWSSTTIEEATRRVSTHTAACHEIAELQRQVLAKMEAHCSAGKVEIETLVRYENVLRNVAVLVKKYEQEIIILRKQIDDQNTTIGGYKKGEVEWKLKLEMEIERTRKEERKRMITRFSAWVMSMWGLRIEALTADFHHMVKKHTVIEDFQAINWEAETVEETETITETETAKLKATATATVSSASAVSAAPQTNGAAKAVTNGVPQKSL
ncbi:hypothetical protein EXIGLDRAFT_731212, partial [Exidia glandulosa HHB12029]